MSDYRSRVIIALALALTPVAAFSQSSQADNMRYSFEGTYNVKDWGNYLYHSFAVPPDVTVIRVKYSYVSDNGSPATLDIGIFDPEKYRGWSGSTRKEFTVSESRALTSDAYLPGEIPPGEWRIILGVPNMEPETAALYRMLGMKVPSRKAVVSYRVEVELSREPVGPPFMAVPRPAVVLKPGPAWFAGDLHCHSTHSDGAYPLEEVIKFAHGQGLDFIAPTEHNSISHLPYLGELQDRYPDMLIISGFEYTTYVGHANIFGFEQFSDFRASADGFDVNRVIDEVHSGSGYFSPNHPASFLGGGIPYLIPGTDWEKVDFYEVTNGRTRIYDFIPNPINLNALMLWDGMLRHGHRITAIGGSDDHQAGHDQGKLGSRIGTPATMVWAEELSSKAILRAMKSGRVYILNEGPKSAVRIDFTATANGNRVMMGDLIEADEVRFQVRVEKANRKTLVIVENGLPMYLPIIGDHFEHQFTRKPRAGGYIRLEIKSGHLPKIRDCFWSLLFRPARCG